jgi:predicted XRE-type DNA-binding protein
MRALALSRQVSSIGKVWPARQQNGIDIPLSADLPPRFVIHHNVVMRLREYLQTHQLTQAAFGQLLTPPVSQGKVNHWINGTRRVSLAEALQIEVVTGGEIQPADLVLAERPLPTEA